MRTALTIFCVILGAIAYPFIHEFFQWVGGNHYPGTAQQSAAVSLLGKGKSIGLALKMYEDEHGWPVTLSEIVGTFGITKESLRYPKIYDMPDRRDLSDLHGFVEWIYIRPIDGKPELPLLIAPLPITSSMGHRLPKPIRIVVNRDSVTEFVDEDKIAPILQALGER